MTTTVLDRPAAPSVTETPIQDAPPRPRRLSDAIRTGAQYHPQGTGYIYHPHTQETCALGALLAGLLGPTIFEAGGWQGECSGLIYEHTGINLDQPLPLLAHNPALRPWFVRTRDDACTLGKAIVYLNDGAGWSRERIADWLASLGF